MAYDKVIDSVGLESDLSSVANAIRNKSGTSDPLAFPEGFIFAIEALEVGAGANFRLLDGTTMPGEGRENDIWVNTDVPIPNYSMSSAEPSNPQPGTVWLKLLQKSDFTINVLDEDNYLGVSLSLVKQYVDDVWVTREAHLYRDGWEAIKTVIRIVPNIEDYPTTKWSRLAIQTSSTSTSSTTLSISEATGVVTLKNPSGTTSNTAVTWGAYVAEYFDLTDFSTMELDIDITFTSKLNSSTTARVVVTAGVYADSEFAVSGAKSLSARYTTVTGTISGIYDISELSGDYRVRIIMAQSQVSNTYLTTKCMINKLLLST